MLFTISSYRIVCFLISRTLPPLSSSFFFPYTVIYITSFGDHLPHRPQHRVLPSPLTPLPSPLSPPLLPPLLPPHPSPVPDDVPREPWRSPPAPTSALCPPLSPPRSPPRLPSSLLPPPPSPMTYLASLGDHLPHRPQHRVLHLKQPLLDSASCL